LLCVSKLESDTKDSGPMGFGEPRHLYHPRLIIIKEAVPFLARLEIDFTAPKKFRSPIGNVWNEHDRQPAFSCPVKRNDDVPKTVVGPETNMSIVLNLGVGVDGNAVHP